MSQILRILTTNGLVYILSLKNNNSSTGLSDKPVLGSFIELSVVLKVRIIPKMRRMKAFRNPILFLFSFAKRQAAHSFLRKKNF